jgi:hypothetical protein
MFTLHSYELSVLVRVTDTDVNLLAENGMSRNVGMSLEQLQENFDAFLRVRYSEMSAHFCACFTSTCPIQVSVVQLKPSHL